METRQAANKGGQPLTISKRIQNRLDSYKWTYLLGWLFIAAVALIFQFIGPTLFERFSSIVEAIAPTAHLALKIFLFIALLLLIPLAAGWLARILLKSMQGRRNVEALQVMQEKLFAEVSEGKTRGFPVALVNWPNEGFRSLEVITSTFKESEGGRELAGIYVPGTPDPTSGTLKVVAIEDLTMTEWSIENLTDFHVTFGSVCPTSC